MKIVLVEWDDSKFVEGGWMLKKEIHHRFAMKCIAIGVMTIVNENQIILVPYFSPTECAKSIIIPISGITRMRTLKVGGSIPP